ncbi:MAG: KH domain-containing protein [bacterium]
MLIPEKLVAFFIGSKGRAIKKLMHDSNTDIIVSPENKNSIFRGVKITGKINQ